MTAQTAVNPTEVNEWQPPPPTWFLSCLGLGCAYWTGSIAGRKGRNAVRWGVFGFCLGVFALLTAYFVPPAKQPAFD